MQPDLAQQIDDLTAVFETEKPATARAAAHLVVAYSHLQTAEMLRMTLGWHTTQRDQLATDLITLADEVITNRESR